MFNPTEIGFTLSPFGGLAAAVLLASCSLMPDYQAPGAPVSSRFPGGTGGGGTHASEIPWKSFYHEARLKKLIELALVNNRDLRVAVLNVEKSRASYQVTRSSSYPGVDAEGSHGRSRQNGKTSDQWNASVGSTAYEVDFFGRVRSLNQQALEQYFATDEARRSAQISLVAEVATQYFILRQAEEQVALANETLKLVEGSFQLNKAMLDAGENNELDYRTAEGQVETAKIDALSYERQIAQAANALVLLVGQSLPTNLPAARSFQDGNLLSSIPSGLPSELIQRRPDILQTENTLKAANANIGAARAAFFPTVTLTGSAGTSSGDLSNLLRSGSGTWSFTPRITVPIFDGGSNQANLSIAETSKRIEVANYEKSIQSAFREVADALVAVSNYTSQIESRDRLINSQEKRYEIAAARYQQGEDTYLNVLSAQRDLYSARQGSIDARYNKLASQISFYKALGGGWK